MTAANTRENVSTVRSGAAFCQRHQNKSPASSALAKQKNVSWWYIGRPLIQTDNAFLNEKNRFIRVMFWESSYIVNVLWFWVTKNNWIIRVICYYRV